MSDLIVNGNGRAPARKGKDFCTRDEAAQIAQEACVLVVEHYMSQVPVLVGRVVEAALMAYDKGKAEQANGAVKSPETRESIEPVPSDSRHEEVAQLEPHTADVVAEDDGC